MGRYVVVRAYSMALTLLGLTVLVFLMLRLIPGTVVEQMIGADAIVSPEMVEQLKRFFGLDEPWYLQYARWLGSLAQGDLGTSWRTGKPVLRLILERLPVTIELTLLAVGGALALGIAAGIVYAIRRDRNLDNAVRVGALLGLSPGEYAGSGGARGFQETYAAIAAEAPFERAESPLLDSWFTESTLHPPPSKPRPALTLAGLPPACKQIVKAP